MEITQYRHDGCGACTKQDKLFERSSVSRQTRDVTQNKERFLSNGFSAVPATIVECNGERRKFEGVTSVDEMTSHCSL